MILYRQIKERRFYTMGYISLFNDTIRIGRTIEWGDKNFGFSLDNGLFDYNQFNFKWFYVCWLNKEERRK